MTGALDDTNDESTAAWFRYPLEDTPALMVHLARSVGSRTISVRVEGDMDSALAERVETTIDLL